uniref:DUF4216 domain-containing protein n=1 Tax=Ananas comosus var. bracteatus TaxID=296719 RepID=A0A6V7NVR4_ANACO|nr:unnamed protein product [Ananas comosus var. bracteatus]
MLTLFKKNRPLLSSTRKPSPNTTKYDLPAPTPSHPLLLSLKPPRILFSLRSNPSLSSSPSAAATDELGFRRPEFGREDLAGTVAGGVSAKRQGDDGGGEAGVRRPGCARGGVEGVEGVDGEEVVLFKCEWVDVTHGKGLKRDEYGFTLINFSHLIHTGEKLEDEPFIFATQAEQVFYVEDELNPEWSTVIKFKPRDVYDMRDDNLVDMEYEHYHVSLLEGLLDNPQDSHFWVRTDIEGTTVDACSSYANES